MHAFVHRAAPRPAGVAYKAYHHHHHHHFRLIISCQSQLNVHEVKKEMRLKNHIITTLIVTLIQTTNQEVSVTEINSFRNESLVFPTPKVVANIARSSETTELHVVCC